MTRLEVFDPPMCCSTGVCGPEVDPVLVRFAADLRWLTSQGVAVERYNLAQQPQAFAANDAVKSALSQEGNPCLPLIIADGRIVSRAVYPGREQLARFAGIEMPPQVRSIYTEAVAELVAIGAAIASNCEPCFKYHFDRARKLGVSHDDMALAVATAQMVKETPARAVLELADRYLTRKQPRAATLPVMQSSCCTPGTPGKE